MKYMSDLPPPPEGVTLREPEDYDSARKNIFSAVESGIKSVLPQSYGGVRIEAHDVDWADPEEIPLEAQHNALVQGQSINRRLRGTLRLYDETTGQLLDERRQTLLKVPHLSHRGTFINNGSEYTTMSMDRLLPGAQTRRKANGNLECFHSSTLIWTEHGMMPIGKIVNGKLPVKVWSYDFDASKFVLKPVVHWFRNKITSKIGRASFDAKGRCPTLFQRGRGVLWMTPTHRVLELSGHKREVSIQDRPLLMVEETFNEDQLQVVLGSLLGDGHINADGIFQETHALAQRPYLEWKSRVLGAFVENGVNLKQASKSSYGSATHVADMFTKSSAELRRLREAFYPNGVKVIPSTWLRKLDARALAVWFGDDGCSILADNGKSETSCRIVQLSTLGFAESDVSALVAWLATSWGIASKAPEHVDVRSSQTSVQRYIKISGEDSERFLDLVAPFLHESLRYKLGTRPKNGARAAKWDARQLVAGTGAKTMEATGAPAWTLVEVPYAYSRVEGSVYDSTRIAYDIEVEGTHNYIANGVLVSNCQFNPRTGTGPNFKVSMDPDSAVFYMEHRGSRWKLYPLLRAMGHSDEELQKRWGQEIWEVNRNQRSAGILDKAYAKLVRRGDPSIGAEAKGEALKGVFEGAQVHRDVVGRTLPALVR